MAQAAPTVRAIWPYREDFEVAPPTPRGARAQRGIGLRARTSFPLLFCEGPHVAHCRAVELSPTGIVVDRGRELSEREQRALFKLELYLPEVNRPIRVLAKLARRVGHTAYALRFVLVADVDRLSLMEHIDREQRETLQLLGDLEAQPQPANT
jgi:hypothetical protein